MHEAQSVYFQINLAHIGGAQTKTCMIVKKLHKKMNMGVYTCMPEVSKQSKETSLTPAPLAHVPTHHLHQVADSLALLNPPPPPPPPPASSLTAPIS